MGSNKNLQWTVLPWSKIVSTIHFSVTVTNNYFNNVIIKVFVTVIMNNLLFSFLFIVLSTIKCKNQTMCFEWVVQFKVKYSKFNYTYCTKRASYTKCISNRKNTYSSISRRHWNIRKRRVVLAVRKISSSDGMRPPMRKREWGVERLAVEWSRAVAKSYWAATLHSPPSTGSVRWQWQLLSVYYPTEWRPSLRRANRSYFCFYQLTYWCKYCTDHFILID